MQFVEFWHAITGHDLQWLYFDSKLVPYAELLRLNERGIWFVTIRRRGAALLRRLQALPPTAWRRALIDIPKRRHQHVRYVAETTTLRGYAGAIRQVAVDGLGIPTQPSFCPTTSMRVHGTSPLVMLDVMASRIASASASIAFISTV
jgi:hypothetical protein